MAVAGMSSLVTPVNGDAYNRRNSNQLFNFSCRASLRQSKCASPMGILDSTQKLNSQPRDNSILRPTYGLSNVSKLPFTTHQAQNSRVKWHRMQIKCSSTETNHADSSGTSKGGSLPKLLKASRRAAMVASFSVAFGACSCCRAALAAEDWSYGGPSGPPTWTGKCATGAKQSPIDVPMRNNPQHGEAPLGELMFDYKMSSPTFKNPGHGTMEVEFPEGVNKLWLNGRELNLVQFHFHTPSEHAFDGLRFPMEAHLVHQDAVNKAFAVVGIMLDANLKAKSNGALSAALKYSPLQHGKTTLTVPKDLQVTPASLLPPTAMKNNLSRYVHYSGSFTTPPCTESVDWLLLETPLPVSTYEVLEFLKFVGDFQTLALNARPIQPLGGRPISEGP